MAKTFTRIIQTLGSNWKKTNIYLNRCGKYNQLNIEFKRDDTPKRILIISITKDFTSYTGIYINIGSDGLYKDKTFLNFIK